MPPQGVTTRADAVGGGGGGGGGGGRAPALTGPVTVRLLRQAAGGDRRTLSDRERRCTASVRVVTRLIPGPVERIISKVSW